MPVLYKITTSPSIGTELSDILILFSLIWHQARSMNIPWTRYKISRGHHTAFLFIYYYVDQLTQTDLHWFKGNY